MWVLTFGVATGEEAWELYVNMWDMEKGWLQVFGLDSHPFYWGSHWGYSRDTSYVPCRDVRTGFITGKPCMNPIRYSLWAYIMENLYRPCCDVRIWVMTGKPEPFRSFGRNRIALRLLSFFRITPCHPRREQLRHVRGLDRRRTCCLHRPWLLS